MNSLTKLLLVDDHQIVLDGIKSMLAPQPNLQVINEALNAVQAFDLVQQNPSLYDLVLTDISMPQGSGINLCKQLKSHFPRIKVMMVSMHDEVENIKNAMAAEADGYMLKSASRNEFIMGINQVIDNGFYYSQQIVPIIISQIDQQTKAAKTNLSKREIEILELIAKEFTSKEIADKLFISKLTVDTHRTNLLEKTGSKSLVGLIKYAIQSELVRL
jgi:DNA-binding NarL/FixJ family response regulator